MRCWNCNHKVTRKAKVCGHCEADLSQAPSAEDAAAVGELLEQMPADILAELSEVMSKSATAEDFANLIMVVLARAVEVSIQATARPIPKSTICSSVVATTAVNCGVRNAVTSLRQRNVTAIAWTTLNSIMRQGLA